MRVVRCYISGPLGAGDLCHNVNQATDAFVRLAKVGIAPLCPHWSVYCKAARYQSKSIMPQSPVEVWCQATVDGCPGMTHEDWLAIDLAWVQVSDCLLRLPGESKGADQEVAHAIVCGLPVFHTVEEVVKWASR